MSSVNKVILVGNLGSDPELRTAGGHTVCKLIVTTSRTFKDDSGNEREITEWHRVTVFGRQAESAAKYLSKGRRVYIEGRLETSEWQDHEGQKRSRTEIVANTVQFLSPPPAASYGH